jgi:hypothetical protein
MAEATQMVGRFEIVRRIGGGGMAVVYLARQPGLDRDVALKELRRFDDETDSALAERFLREARMAGSLGHPNIVTVFDYFEHDGTPYIAMEYMERGSLRPLVGRLALAQTAGALEGLLSGLSYAESRGIVHRDLKPENLLIGAGGGIKIADLGIAKAFNQISLGLTRSGMAIGTPTYMAPEQATAKQVGPWTDVYAAGVIAYELLVGRVPFLEIDTPLSVLWQHVHDPVPPPLTLRPDLDPSLAAWLEWLLAKAPEERPRTAREAWTALEELVVEQLGWRWRQQASLAALAAEGADPLAANQAPARAAETPAEPTPPPPAVPTDGFRTFTPPRGRERRRPPEPRPEATPAPTGAVEGEEPVAPPEVAEPLVETPAEETVAEAEAEPEAQPEPEAEPATTIAPLAVSDEATDFSPTLEAAAPRRRRPLRLALAAAAALAAGLAVLAGFVLTRGGGPPPPPPPPPPLPDPKPRAADLVALAVDGTRIVLGSPAGRIVVLDAATLEPGRVRLDPADPRAALARRGAIWVGDDRTLTRYDADLRALAAVPFSRGVQLAAAPGGQLVVSGASRTGGRLCVLGAEGPVGCIGLPFLPSGLGADGEQVFAVDRDGSRVVAFAAGARGLARDGVLELEPRSAPHGTPASFRGRLYVAVERGIAVVDLASGRLERTIHLPTTPADLWVVPFNGRLFAPLFAQDRVAVLDLTAERPRPRLVPAGDGPVAVAGPLSSAVGGDAVYVVGARDRTVLRLDALTGRQLDTARVAALSAKPVEPLALRRVGVTRKGRVATVRLRLAGGRLEPAGLRRVDVGIADGGAVLELWQGGIRAVDRRGAGGGVTIRVVPRAGRLVVRVIAKPGEFERLKAARSADGQSVVLTLLAVPPRPDPVDTDPVDSDPVDPVDPVETDPGDGDGSPGGCASPRPGPNYTCVNGRWIAVG